MLTIFVSWRSIFDHMKEKVPDLHKSSSSADLKINIEKIKEMHITPNPREN